LIFADLSRITLDVLRNWATAKRSFKVATARNPSGNSSTNTRTPVMLSVVFWKQPVSLGSAMRVLPADLDGGYKNL